jgi:plasminogen activator inhibitor 1 RNA-binding protein
MENTYGIGVANRYDLFMTGEDDMTDFETVVKKKKEKKSPPATGLQPSTGAAPAAAKVQPQKAAGNLGNKENKQTKKVVENGTGIAGDQRRGIKEQNNKDNLSTVQRKDGGDKGNKDSKNREERNNRKNREINGNGEFDKPRGTGNNNNGTTGGQQRNQRRGFADGRKRERDRQSGSDKTGVKSVDKRDGAGSHNWGNHKQDIDDLNKPHTDEEQKESADDTAEDNAPKENVEDEPKEMTLDEWKAQRQASLLQPQYNIRKAGEGEDNSQWQNMKRLDSKKADEDGARKDDSANLKKDDGKKKQVLDIEFHFSDNRRGGLGRRSGGPGRTNNSQNGERGDRGDRGERGAGNGDRGARRPRPNRDNNREGGGREHREHREPREKPVEGGNPAAAADGVDRSERRQQRRPRFENNRRVDKNVPNAPKVDDERDFPSLG